ncbi:MAG: hypothetical protein ACRC0G_15330 [Fusobacteriaceae bacterium]
MLKNNTFEDFLNKIEETLGANIDPSSIDTKIFKCFYDLTYAISEKTETEVKSMFFENLRGNDLDNVMEFFDTYRNRGGDSDLYEFNLYNSSEKTFLIKKGSVLNFENKSYKVLQDIYINKGLNELVCQQNGQVSDFNKPVFTKDGVIVFNADSISGAFKDITSIFTSAVKLSTYRIQSDEIESDFEFKEKSKSVMQSLGLSNSFKIKSEILGNPNVKNVVVSEEDDLTRFVVVPISLSVADDVLENAKEIAKYFKNGNVVVELPSVVEVELSGVDQLFVFEENYQEIKDDIVSIMLEYLSTNFTGSIQKNKIIDMIQTIVDNKAVIKNHDVYKIKVFYNFYSKDNYETSILTAEIINNKNIEDNSVVTFGRIV